MDERGDIRVEAWNGPVAAALDESIAALDAYMTLLDNQSCRMPVHGHLPDDKRQLVQAAASVVDKACLLLAELAPRPPGEFVPP